MSRHGSQPRTGSHLGLEEKRWLLGIGLSIGIGAVLLAPEKLDAQVPFRRGDLDGDGQVGTMADVLLAINPFAIFPCSDAGDVNDDGLKNILDGVHLVNFLIGDVPELPLPGTFGCGLDPTDFDVLDCHAYSTCALVTGLPASPDHSLRIESAEGIVGTQIEVSVRYDNLFNEPTQGIALGVCHDAGLATLVSVGFGSAFSELPDVFLIQQFADGWTGMAISSVTGIEFIMGVDQELFVATYETAASGDLSLTICEGLATPETYISLAVSTFSGVDGFVPHIENGVLTSIPDPQFRRGDANDDGTTNIADAVSLLTELFGNGPASPCADAADANDDGALDIGDPIAVLNTLFGGSGPPLPEPGSSTCGVDPTADDLRCAALCP